MHQFKILRDFAGVLVFAVATNVSTEASTILTASAALFLVSQAVLCKFITKYPAPAANKTPGTGKQNDIPIIAPAAIPAASFKRIKFPYYFEIFQSAE